MRRGRTRPGVFRCTFCLLIIAVIAAGCSSSKKPPPLSPPVVSATVSYRAGAPTAFSATQPAPPVNPTDALGIHVTWLALSDTPRALRPILAEATFIAAPRAADPVRAAGKLSEGTKIVPPEKVEDFLTDLDRGKFGQRADIVESDAALPRGVTASLALADSTRRIEIDLHSPPDTATSATMPTDAIQLSLALDDADAQRERLLLDPRPMPPPARFALVLPAYFASSGVKAI